MAKITPFNMSRILRKLNYRTGQSRKITYYRPPVYSRDDYGVEASGVTVNELVMPNTQAYIRLRVGKDYQLQKAGVNIVGTATVYMPRLETLKNFPNYDQENNTYFNEIEGWDQIIDIDRVVYRVPTSSSTGWISGSTGLDGNDTSFTSDGESITATFGTNPDGAFSYSGSSTGTNSLEADRISFQVKASSSATLQSFYVYNGADNIANSLQYDNANIAVPSTDWMTIDVPFASGGYITSGASNESTSIYLSGSRYRTVVSGGTSHDYKNDFYRMGFVVDSADNDALYIKNVKFYKSIPWSVHRVNDYTDEYMKLSCVRTQGKSQKMRRAYNG